MALLGTVHNGVIVLQDDGSPLPDGTQVEVVPIALESPRGESSGRDTPESQPSDTGAETIWQKLARIAREVEQTPCDLPEDLAANHDHYLHGTPKRE